MCSWPTRNRNFKKIAEKFKKIRKHQHSFISSQNRVGERPRKR